MIMSHQVEEMAKEYLGTVLNGSMTLGVIFSERPFKEFIKKATVKCNQMDLYLTSKGHKITKGTMKATVQQFSLVYARSVLDKLGLELKYDG